MKYAIIIPTYNERENIEKIIPEIEENLRGVDHQIVIADDNSPDGTWKKALELSKQYPTTVILRGADNVEPADNLIVIPQAERGLSAAVIDAFKNVTADYYIVMDADGQHPPESLPEIIKRLHNCDLVIGSRYVPGAKIEKWSTYRLIISKSFTYIVYLFLPEMRQIKDVNAGFFGVRGEIVQKSVDEYDAFGFKILWEVIVKGKPQKICEVPITFRNRMYGYSKAGPRVAWEGLKNMIKLRKYSKHRGVLRG